MAENNIESTGLSPETIKRIYQVFAHSPEIEQVYIYGSRAKGNYQPGSDIDLAIKGKQVTTSQLYRIESELDDLLLPYKIDLSLLHCIENQALLKHIRRVGIIFYTPDMLVNSGTLY
ncbi:MAG: nucleotidyltransferase domain-containing protein [Desulfobacteraceae bacterium]